MTTQTVNFKLARISDARRIAEMSKRIIEHGLDWTWTPRRVLSRIRCRETVVLTARLHGEIVGFAVMYFAEYEAHLHLLGVEPAYQSTGVASQLLQWLEDSARVAGVTTITLEVRETNQNAREFYKRRGYQPLWFMEGYYGGQEGAVRMVRRLTKPERGNA